MVKLIKKGHAPKLIIKARRLSAIAKDEYKINFQS